MPPSITSLLKRRSRLSKDSPSRSLTVTRNHPYLVQYFVLFQTNTYYHLSKELSNMNEVRLEYGYTRYAIDIPRGILYNVSESNQERGRVPSMGLGHRRGKSNRLASHWTNLSGSRTPIFLSGELNARCSTPTGQIATGDESLRQSNRGYATVASCVLCFVFGKHISSSREENVCPR
jgi:hypothetical protein